ncbi:hypothetical protein [Pseudomonas syringae]|uniref:hypothetical protein n=1 Tax=Pseudomonas syringae TaxID=317 RepID=UPI0013729705|nr:hypothetical protein [Pseudomonas syringae]
MSYFNPRHESRLVIMPSLPNAFACVQVHKAPPWSVPFALEGADEKIVYLADEVVGGDDRDLFNFPFLFHANGDSWHEANDYLLSLLKDKPSMNRRTDDVRRRLANCLIISCSAKMRVWIGWIFREGAHHCVQLIGTFIT